MNELALGMRIAVDSPKGICGFMGAREVKSLETCYFFTVFSLAMVLDYVGFFIGILVVVILLMCSRRNARMPF